MKLLALFLTCASFLAQEAEKAKAAVTLYQKRVYRMMNGGKQLGTATLTSRVAGDAMIFDDTVNVKDGGRSFVFGLKSTYALNASMTLRGADVTGQIEYTGVIKDKVFSGNPKTGPKSVELGSATVAGFSLFRQLAIVEAKEGAEIKYDELEIEHITLRKGITLRFAGTVKSSLAGKAVDAAKWTMKDDGRDVTMIVAGGVVLSVVNGDVQVLLEEEGTETRSYRHLVKGKEVGSFTLRTRAEGETLQFEDLVHSKVGERDVEIAFRETVDKETLRTTSFHVRATGGDEIDLSGTIKDGTLTLTIRDAGAESEKRIKAEGEIHSWNGLLRYVARLAPKEGAEFIITRLDPVDARLFPGEKIAYAGVEKVTVGGSEREAHKWTKSGGKGDTYWVADGVVIKAVLDNADELQLSGK